MIIKNQFDKDLILSEIKCFSIYEWEKSPSYEETIHSIYDSIEQRKRPVKIIYSIGIELHGGYRDTLKGIFNTKEDALNHIEGLKQLQFFDN